MEVLVVADSIFYRAEDGSYWCKTIYGYDFWTRYTEVFKSVAVVSRTKHVSKSEVKGYHRVDGPKVRIIELPYMRGMKQYIRNFFQLRKLSKKIVNNSDFAIFRLPSVVAFMVLDFFSKTQKPYLIEIVADPKDAYASNWVAKNMYVHKLKEAAIDANGVSYVTQFYLQNEYPAYSSLFGESENKFETYYSTIDLKDSFFAKPKDYSNETKPFKLVHTANSINSDIKGHNEVLEIVKATRDMGLDVEVTFIGDGTKKKHFEKKAKELGIDDYVKFTGLLSSSQDVRNELLKSDLFVFPSKAEGLPRAIIEAMAVGLPCLSTPVNGIPELIESEFLFDPKDIIGFANKIATLIEDRDALTLISKRNIQKAKEYKWDILSRRRTDFYSKLLILRNMEGEH